MILLSYVGKIAYLGNNLVQRYSAPYIKKMHTRLIPLDPINNPLKKLGRYYSYITVEETEA